VHHRRLFAPVVAAREKHEGPAIGPGIVALETPVAVDVAATI